MSDVRLHNFTIYQLRVFCAVARHLSYTRAAAALGCKQPTVSTMIAHLERMTQLILIEQQGKRLALTDEGHELYEHAQEVVEAADELYRAAADLHGAETPKKATLSVAADTTVGTYVMPHLLGAFHQLHPEVTLYLHVANRTGVRARLLEHLADLVVAGRPPAVDGLVIEPFLANKLIVVAAPNHPLASRTSVPLAELAGERFVLREEGSGTRAAIEELFEVAGLPLKTGMVLGHIESIKQAVIARLGVSIFSEVAIQRELEEGLLIILPVEEFPIERHWYITRLVGHPLSPGGAAFIEFLRAESQKYQT